MSKELKANKDTIEVLLVLTEKCNLNCSYCYEVNKSSRKMSFETAKCILDDEFNKVSGTEQKIVIQFFGGECTLEFGLIQKIYDYVMDKNSPNFDCFFAVTNGTTLTAEMKQWMSERKDNFICGLSLDGTKEVHDINRSNSYDLIDFKFFSVTWPKQKIKMTISPGIGLEKLSESVIHCHELGFGVLCNLADGVDWDAESSELLKRELEKLVSYYIDNPEKEICSILQMPLLHVGINERTSFPKWCGLGDHIHAYDVMGEVHPCQLFMHLSGNTYEFPEIKKKYLVEEFPERCRDCILLGCCPTCMGSNILRQCHLFYHTEVECRNIKLQFLTTSYLMYERYKRNLLKLTQEEEYVLLNAIKKIQTEFSDL